MQAVTQREVKERPILFSGPMVRAILDGRKTQTRRLVKHRITGPSGVSGGKSLFDMYNGEVWVGAFDLQGNGNARDNCPYGKPGDRLWVRETWCRQSTRPGSFDSKFVTVYRSDFLDDPQALEAFKGEWKPSIHMPREASRITLEITNVRVERLQDISPNDVIAEGVVHSGVCNSGLAKYPRGVPAGISADRNCDCAVYSVLWDKINGKKHPWSSNPWVWVIEFNKV